MTAQPRYRILNRDAVKYLAILLMFIGHAVAWWYLVREPGTDTTSLPFFEQALMQIGVFCPPVMFFMIADGYKYTRDRKKYALRLLLFALITQPFDWLLFQPVNGWLEGNVIFTLFCSLLALIVWEQEWKLPLRLLAVAGIIGINALTKSEWYGFAEVTVICLHAFREKPKLRLLSYTLIFAVNVGIMLLFGYTDAARPICGYLSQAVGFAAIMAAYACMTVFYNGKKGRHPVFAKWFFYAFYPLHYLVIWLGIQCLTRMPEWIF